MIDETVPRQSGERRETRTDELRLRCVGELATTREQKLRSAAEFGEFVGCINRGATMQTITARAGYQAKFP
ncbi:MAG: hypothetical protein AAF747_12165, partial [Planctomycetota bacterium]